MDTQSHVRTRKTHPFVPCQAIIFENFTQLYDYKTHIALSKVMEYPLEFAILKIEPKVAHIRHPLANVGLHPI
jgi:hypothetical protein